MRDIDWNEDNLARLILNEVRQSGLGRKLMGHFELGRASMIIHASVSCAILQASILHIDLFFLA